ncbi:hypothetical protein KJ567_02225 [Candidatus Bipolaricaulota bacterium]|nr:hypothetical protein [Candidatus Bipolaricaulota bacterium]
MSDLGKIGVIAAIMGALLLFGLLVTPVQPAQEQRDIAPVAETVVTEVRLLAPTSLEMLDPIYSEKAVFQDDTIRIAFDVSHSEEGVESRLPFWLHNISDHAINVLWDRCSIQLPGDNTVNIVNEGGLAHFAPGGVISIAPAGDLFEAAIPVTELDLGSESGYAVSTGVLDKGTFTFVLAIERNAACDEIPGTTLMQRREIQQPAIDCEATPAPAMMGRVTCSKPCFDRETVYYTFRFVIR